MENLHGCGRDSTKDKVFKAQLTTHQHINVLKDVSNAAHDIRNHLSSNKPSKRLITKISNQMSKLEAIIDGQEEKMKAVAKVIARESTIPDISYVARRMHAAHHIEIDNKENNITHPIQRLNKLYDDTIKEGKQLKKKRKKVQNLDIADIIPEFPPPENGREYLKIEATSILQDKSNKDRLLIIKDWIRKELIPVTEQDTIVRLMKRIDMGQATSEHWGGGRPPLMTITALKQSTSILQQETGKALTLKGVKGIIEKHQLEKAAKRGVIIDKTVTPFSPRTTKRYLTLAPAVSPDLSIQTTAIPKTETRCIAEKSLISGLSFLMVIAATHFNVGKNKYFEKNIRPKLSEGAELFVTLVEGYYEAPVHPIPAKFLFSMDDTTEYICKGVAEAKSSWVLVSRASNATAGINSRYLPTTKDGQMRGFCVKNTFIFLADGRMGPIMVTVNGLTEKELAKEHCSDKFGSPDGFFLLRVDGLGVGGGTQVNSSTFGFVLFIRESTKEKDAMRSKIHKLHVLHPFLDALREDQNSDLSLPVPNEDRALLWFDGDHGQLTTYTKDEEEVARSDWYKLGTNKQSAARTGTEQAADLTRVLP